MTVLEKQPSKDLIQMIKVAGDSLLSFGELWGTIKQKGGEEGFTEKELQEMLRPYLKQKMDSKKIWYLFNKEEHNQKSAENYQKRTINRTNDDKKGIEQSAEGSIPVIPEPTRHFDRERKRLEDEHIEEIVKTLPVKDSEQFYKEQQRAEIRDAQLTEGLIGEPPDPEEPTELELANIKIAQLEDALHKTQQFKPAIEITPGEEFKVELNDGVVFEWLRKRDNGINIYFFDNYGRELFSNRILSQLRNSGVKTFKRLYFEI